MVVFASPEWVHELDALARRVAVPPGPDPDGRASLRVVYELTDAPPGLGSYALELTPGGVRAVTGQGDPAPPGTSVITVSQPYELARAVAEGRVAAAAAVLDGRIRVRGPVTDLVAWQPVMGALDDALEPLRVRTTGAPAGPPPEGRT